MGMWGNVLTVLGICMGGIELKQKTGKKEKLEFCDKKELCVANK